MAGSQDKWYFTKEQLVNSPSRKHGVDADKELAYRQHAANLIQDMGQRLQVSQLCINTGIVYMHRFYTFHSFTKFHRNAIAAAALFLAAKVEEQPRKLEYVIKVAHVCLHRGEGVNAITSDQYQEQAQDLVFNENVLLQTLGFDVAIDHPHTHVVRTCHLVKAPKDLAQTSYFMASNSLHLTTMCLQYRPTVVACFCIHLASKWSNWAIPQSNEGKHWFHYVDESVNSDMLERLTSEFLHIFDKCPSRLKRKMMTMSNNSGNSPHSVPGHGQSHSSSSQSTPVAGSSKHHVNAMQDDFDKSFDREYEREKRRPQAPGGYVPASTAPAPTTSTTQKIDYNAYREKREREERERRQQHRPPQPHHNRPQHKPGRAIVGPATANAWPPNKLPHAQKPPEHRRPEAQRTRPPSLFSPENVTTPTAAAAAPRRPPIAKRPERPHSPRKRTDPATVVRDLQPPPIVSPFSSPPPKEKEKLQRVPTEPELVPVVKKLDETPGFENVRERVRPRPQEKRHDPTPPARLNGIETDPTLVSNLLKESLAKPVPITVQTEKSPLIEREKPERVERERELRIEREVKPEISQIKLVKPEVEPPPALLEPVKPEPVVDDTSEHRHKKEKKKKEKHKHKDRDKSKEERKKHKKDKERKIPVPEPIDPTTFRITIPRDKVASPGLKIKIPKDRLAVPPPPPNLPPQTSGIKIKISKELLETSRKRTASDVPGPPTKVARQNGAPKVSWPQYPLPYFMVQPPPTLYYDYFYGMYQMPPNVPNMPPNMPLNLPPNMPSNIPPPLPAMPPPAVPPPPPE